MLLERVLIAEPDVTHAAAIAEVVRILRPKVDPVIKADGFSALRQLKGWRDKELRPLVVIVGEALSRTGGLAVLNYLTTDPFLSPVPVVTFNDAALSPRHEPMVGDQDNWILDVLADSNDPYDLLVKDLNKVLGNL